jgi:serine/threonine protein kinase
MELGEKNLKHQIEERLGNGFNSYDEEELFYIVRSSVLALAFLQKNKISHSDIKPENLLYINHKIKLCDFGSSIRMKSIALEQPLAWAGTSLYMSPQVKEAFEHESPLVRHDPYKSDVFSLGLTFIYVASLLRVSGLNSDPNMLQTRIKDLKDKKSYGEWFFKMLEVMLKFDEKERWCFLQLEEFITEFEGKVWSISYIKPIVNIPL